MKLRDLCTRALGVRHPINLHDCGSDAGWTLVVSMSLAATILSWNEVLEDMVQRALKMARIESRRIRNEERAKGEKVVEDWAENMDVEGIWRGC